MFKLCHAALIRAQKRNGTGNFRQALAERSPEAVFLSGLSTPTSGNTERPMNHQHNKAGDPEKSAGQLGYERDRAAQPNYQDGKTRPTWNRLSDVAKDSWERNPTDRNLQKSTLVSSEQDFDGYEVQGAPAGDRV